nr:helix-turn-helix domain-containing protein [uncultured Sphingomonas sp.]
MTNMGQIPPQHRVLQIVYPGFELLDLSGPAAAFNNANRELAIKGMSHHYGIETTSADGGLVESSCGIAVETAPIGRFISAPIKTVLVAGAERPQIEAALNNTLLSEALVTLADRPVRLGSVCTGSYILAALGLVDGRRVATHWDACDWLAKSFPAVEVDAESIFVSDGRIWTSAGVTAGIDMALAMVAADLGEAIAGKVAKRLVIYARRSANQQQISSLLNAQAKMDSPFEELVEWIHANLDGVLDIPTLAERAGLAERTFHRRFVAAIGNTPARFVEMARLDAARMLLSRGLPLKSAAANVGLFPASRLSDAFMRNFGMSPSQFRALNTDSE